ncbi:MAG: glycosyltransferase 87 family protein [bacterium]|nr:glycosyltransferase 87 family protein [bacterium]
MSFPPFKTDMDSWIAWGEHIYRVGPGGFYDNIWSDYAPGYYYILWVVTAFKHLFFANATREATEFIYKIPPLIFDLMSGVVIYALLNDLLTNRKKLARYLPEITAFAYILNPVTTFNGVIWGQVDNVFTCFLLLSLLAINKNKLYWGTILYVIAGVIKPQAISLLPLYFLLFIYKKDYILTIKNMAVGVITFYVLTIPFFGLNALYKMFNLMKESVNTYPYSSLNSFGLWGAIGFWKNDTGPFILGYSVQTVGTVLYGFSALVGMVLGIRLLGVKDKIIRARNTMLLGSYFILSFVMLMSRMHERYLFPFFAFVTLFVALSAYPYFNKSKEYGWMKVGLPIAFYIIFTILHTINLYYVYVQYQYFDVGVPVANNLYHLISTNINIFSYIMIITYAMFVIMLLHLVGKTTSEKAYE